MVWSGEGPEAESSGVNQHTHNLQPIPPLIDSGHICRVFPCFSLQLLFSFCIAGLPVISWGTFCAGDLLICPLLCSF